MASDISVTEAKGVIPNIQPVLLDLGVMAINWYSTTTHISRIGVSISDAT